MKILKRTKGLLRFRTIEGTIVLRDGENNLTDKEFELVKTHPMYEAMIKTSGLIAIAEKKVELAKTPQEEGIEKDNSENKLDFSNIDLEAQDKKTLVQIAESLKIETKSLTIKELIEKIKSFK